MVHEERVQAQKFDRAEVWLSTKAAVILVLLFYAVQPAGGK